MCISVPSESAFSTAEKAVNAKRCQNDSGGLGGSGIGELDDGEEVGGCSHGRLDGSGGLNSAAKKEWAAGSGGVGPAGASSRRYPSPSVARLLGRPDLRAARVRLEYVLSTPRALGSSHTDPKSRLISAL
ncbi:hypothetical protein PF003_g36253 [Phytophthora fragariae]|nr:hypothetical protein PF003_g36253 [Phytophthora fragariae]